MTFLRNNHAFSSIAFYSKPHETNAVTAKKYTNSRLCDYFGWFSSFLKEFIFTLFPILTPMIYVTPFKRKFYLIG